ncbi:MAG: DUF1330 domain-containing protein [Acidimicrobiia bacterium]|nr:DUF1330 domain-containing protein [Acidimicrobiia bacterium]
MARYFLAQLNVHDPAEYARYLEGTAPLLAEHSGRVLAVDEDVAVLEGEWPYGRTVLIEFPSADHLDAWYASPGYREIAAHRHAASTGNAVSIEGRA